MKKKKTEPSQAYQSRMFWNNMEVATESKGELKGEVSAGPRKSSFPRLGRRNE